MIVGLTFVLLLVLLFINAPVFVAILGSPFLFRPTFASWMMVVRGPSGTWSNPPWPFLLVMAGVFMTTRDTQVSALPRSTVHSRGWPDQRGG